MIGLWPVAVGQVVSRLSISVSTLVGLWNSRSTFSCSEGMLSHFDTMSRLAIMQRVLLMCKGTKFGDWWQAVGACAVIAALKMRGGTIVLMSHVMKIAKDGLGIRATAVVAERGRELSPWNPLVRWADAALECVVGTEAAIDQALRYFTMVDRWASLVFLGPA